MANAAERGRHVLRYPLAIGIGAGLFKISFQEFQNARETKTFFGFGLLPCCSLFTGRAAIRWRVAVQKHVLDARREFLEGRFEIEAMCIGPELIQNMLLYGYPPSNSS